MGGSPKRLEHPAPNRCQEIPQEHLGWNYAIEDRIDIEAGFDDGLRPVVLLDATAIEVMPSTHRVDPIDVL